MTDRNKGSAFSAPTELGSTVKLFGGSRDTMTPRDLGDFDQVYDLASELATAGPRRVMRLTNAEILALASFAVKSGVITSRVAEIVRLHDAKAPRDLLIAKLDELGEFARPLLRLS